MAEAEAEIALVSRDLSWPVKPLETACEVLERQGDRTNAAHAGYLMIRYLVLIGRLDRAERRISTFDSAALPSASRAAYELTLAGLAIRSIKVETARASLTRAEAAAQEAGIAGLKAEVRRASSLLQRPAARLTKDGAQRSLLIDEVETLLASSETIVVDACRHGVCHAGNTISLTSRPVQFSLVRALAEVWPGDAPRSVLVARAFRAREADGSHRARLRVEIGRLRNVLRRVVGIEATKDGFVLVPDGVKGIAVLAPPDDEPHAAKVALLSDGEAWPSSALALALGASQRTLQRALDELDKVGRVRKVGRGRALRWMAPPVPAFPTSLLLPAAFPGV